VNATNSTNAAFGWMSRLCLALSARDGAPIGLFAHQPWAVSLAERSKLRAAPVGWGAGRSSPSLAAASPAGRDGRGPSGRGRRAGADRAGAGVRAGFPNGPDSAGQDLGLSGAAYEPSRTRGVGGKGPLHRTGWMDRGGTDVQGRLDGRDYSPRRVAPRMLEPCKTLSTFRAPPARPTAFG
jgi:hypothetical protein